RHLHHVAEAAAEFPDEEDRCHEISVLRLRPGSRERGQKVFFAPRTPAAARPAGSAVLRGNTRRCPRTPTPAPPPRAAPCTRGAPAAPAPAPAGPSASCAPAPRRAPRRRQRLPSSLARSVRFVLAPDRFQYHGQFGGPS